MSNEFVTRAETAAENAQLAANQATEAMNATAADRQAVEELVSTIDTTQIPSIQASKEAIRNAIVEQGQECDETVAFADYANKILAIETGVDVSDADSVTGADIRAPKKVYGSDGTLVTGTLAEVTAERVAGTNQVQVPAGIHEDQTINVGTVYSGDTTITPGESAVTIAADTLLLDGLTVAAVIDSGSSEVTYGYLNADGLMQPIDISGDTPIDSGDPISIDLKVFQTGKPLPEYPTGGGSMDFYKCAAVDKTAKTWDGYKAVLTDGEYYYFEETVTEGLSYGTAFTPAVDVIYSADATVVVSALYKKSGPITLNDTNCLIFIDGSSLSNQALASNKQEVTFGTGVSFADGYIVCPNNSSGRITTKARNDGFGGSLTTWTWDYYFISDASYLDCSGHSDRNYAPTLEGEPGESLFWRSQNSEGKRLGVPFEQNQLICLSMQWDAGELHIWNKGKYIGVTTPSFTDHSGTTLGINCDGWNGNYDRMADKIKLFRFSNIARYTPGVDFELPEGFLPA